MGANAQTTVPTFTSGQVLTADQQNQSARTGVPVFSSTVTRDAGFGGTGEKTLAEGQLCYVEGTGLQTYDGTSWVTWGTAPTGGLTLISSTTAGSAVSSVTVTGAFSSTYDNYKIIVAGGTASANMVLQMTLGSTSTGYYWINHLTTYATGVDGSNTGSNVGFWAVGGANTNTAYANIDVMSPNLTKNTIFQGGFGNSNSIVQAASSMAGILNDSTAYTAFTLTCSTGNITGTTIKVYGYKN